MHKPIAKWLSWYETIVGDAENMLLCRKMFFDLHEIIQNNPELQKPDFFHEYMRDTYIAHICSGVRRQFKDNSDSISLARLLREISEHPKFLSREYFRSLYASGLADHADTDFDKFSGQGNPHIDPLIVIRDLQELKAAAVKSESFIDRRVSHFDKREPTMFPTYDDINHSVNLIDRLLVKYGFVLKLESRDTIMPAAQNGWLGIFRTPWIVE